MFHPQGPTFWELAQQCLSSTERGYDLLASKFDYTPFRTPDELLEPIKPFLADGPPIARGLDICCGTGAGMRLLRSFCSETVAGIDFSQGMMEVGRERLADAPGEAALQFVRGDVLAMPFEEPFDVAVCFGALGHILPRDEPRFVEQVKRTLKPGGRFIFVTTEMPSLWSKSYWLSRGFNAAMRVRNLFWRPKFIMYYLTFLLPRASELLTQAGFSVETPENCDFSPFSELRLVIATKQ